MSFKDKDKINKVPRTHNNPSMLFNMIFDGMIIALAGMIAWMVEYRDLSSELEHIYRRGSDVTKVFVLNAAYDAITTAIAVFLVVFVAIYLYWLRAELMQMVAYGRWILLKRRYGLDLGKPDVKLDNGVGWHLEQLLGKDVHLIACFAHDGTLTIVDRPSDGFTFIDDAAKAKLA